MQIYSLYALYIYLHNVLKVLQAVMSACSVVNHIIAHFMAVHAIPMSWNALGNVNWETIICKVVYKCINARNASNIKTANVLIN